jgi:hypothetical protein
MGRSAAAGREGTVRELCAGVLRVGTIAAVALVGLAPVLATAQVYKCVDASGATTYQQEPCAGGQQGRALNLKPEKDTPAQPDMTPQWSAAASEGRVVTGMPRQFVTQALGAPAERRPPRTGEAGGEVWVYVKANEMTRVGFVGDVVAWTMRDAVKSPEAVRTADARNKVAAGRNCDEVRAELGPADRQENVTDLDPATGQARGVAATRYIYEPGPSDGGVRLSFTCIENRVLDIGRTLYAR